MSMKKVSLDVEGMSCEHCVKSIKGAVIELDGVEDVSVELDEKKVDVEYDDKKVDIETIKEVIVDQGYDVE